MDYHISQISVHLLCALARVPTFHIFLTSYIWRDMTFGSVKMFVSCAVNKKTLLFIAFITETSQDFLNLIYGICKFYCVITVREVECVEKWIHCCVFANVKLLLDVTRFTKAVKFEEFLLVHTLYWNYKYFWNNLYIIIMSMWAEISNSEKYKIEI